MNEINPAILDAFQRASSSLGGREPDIKFMQLVKVDNVKDMVMVIMARLTQQDSNVRVQLSGTFQTKSGFVTKVGTNIDISGSEFTGFKGLSGTDVLKKHMGDAMTAMWASGLQAFDLHNMADALKTNFKLPTMVEEKPKLLHYEIGIDAAKAGKDLSKVQVIGPDAVVELKPIAQLSDVEVKAEIAYLKTRNNLVGGIGSCGGKNESEEERRRGDLSALRALDAHLHRAPQKPKEIKGQLLSIHP